MTEYRWRPDLIVDVPPGVHPEILLERLAKRIVDEVVTAGGRVGGEMGYLMEVDDPRVTEGTDGKTNPA